MNEPPTETALRRLLWAVLAVALFLRVWGLDYGLPHIYMTDEWFEVKRALKLGAGVLDFDRVGKGFYFYLLFGAFGAYFAVMRLFGAVGGSEDFLLSIFRDPTGLWLVGRGLTALIGVATVGMLYRTGRCLQDRTVGLVAAAMLAIHIMHVRSSHSITVDVPLVFFVLLGLTLLYQWQDREDLRGRHYALLGVVTAAATATKLPGAVFLFCVLVFHARRFRRGGRAAVLDYLLDRRFGAYVLAGAVSYLAFEPGIVFHIGRIARLALSFILPAAAVAARDPSLPLAPDRVGSLPLFYGGGLFPLAYTVLPLLFLGGVWIAIRRRGVTRQPGLIFAALFFGFLIASKDPQQVYIRYVLPILPVVLLYASLGLVELCRGLARRSRPATLIAPALGLLLAVPMVVHTVRMNVGSGYPDTRTLAKDWVEARVPAGSAIYIAGGLTRTSALTAPLKMTPDRVDAQIGRRLDSTGQDLTGEKSLFYEIYKRALAEYDPTYDLILLDEADILAEALRENRGEWALMIMNARPQFDHEVNRRAFPERWELFRRIDAGEFVEVQRFLRGPRMNGHDLVLYRRADLEASP